MEFCVKLLSLPLWERGLKSQTLEEKMSYCVSLPLWERGLKSLSNAHALKVTSSLPLWERGLKYDVPDDKDKSGSRSPCGSVD